MYKKTINPRKVVIWEHQKTTPELERLALEGKLEPVPVFEMPFEFKYLGDYLIIDGHHRTEAAKKKGVNLPILVLQTAKDIKHVPSLRGVNIDPDSFEIIKYGYIQEAISLKRKNS